MRSLAALKQELELWDSIQGRSDEIIELVELAIVESDHAMLNELRVDVDLLASDVDEQEFTLSLGGENDSRPAIVSVKQGAGGVEAQDWSEMLIGMYLQWSERSGYESEVLDNTPGDTAGIKAASIKIDGDHAYGYLKSERGVHRLQRFSPYGAGNRRHTSFSLVEVYPEPDETDELEIDESELRWTAIRAKGNGGQSVQKNLTAIRLTHESTGIVVSVQNERSQNQNKQIAKKILHARLTDMENQRRADEKAKLKGDHISAEFGRQIRTYTLAPYRMVKDHRTKHEVSDAHGVLAGNLDGFMKAYLQSTIGMSINGSARH